MMRWIALSFKIDQPAQCFEHTVLPGVSPEASQVFWLELGLLCFSYTPFVSRIVDQNCRPDGQFRQGFLLEISRCLRLFKGEYALYRRLVAGVDQLSCEYLQSSSMTQVTEMTIAASPYARAAWWRSLLAEPICLGSKKADKPFAGGPNRQTNPQLPPLLRTSPTQREDASMSLDAIAGSLVEQACSPTATISQLPTLVLDLTASQRSLLMQLGLYKLDHLEKLPRAELSRRLGPATLREIDQGLGREPAMIQKYTVPALFEAEREMPFHAKDTALIEKQALKVLENLESWLKNRQLSASELNWTFKLPHGQQHLRVRSARWLHRSNDWMRLMTHHLSRFELDDEVTYIALRCDRFRPQSDYSRDLFDGSSFEIQQDWLVLCDEIAGRLGREALARFELQSDPRPELGFRRLNGVSTLPGKANFQKRTVSQKQTVIAGSGRRHDGEADFSKRASGKSSRNGEQNLNALHAALYPSTERPLALLETPKPIRGHKPDWFCKEGWRLVSGPERIEFGWWDQQACKRDYYRAINQDQVQGWIYQDRDPAAGQSCIWYLHGYFV